MASCISNDQEFNRLRYRSSHDHKCSISKSLPLPGAFVSVITPSFSRAALLFSSSSNFPFVSANLRSFPSTFPPYMHEIGFSSGVRRSSNSSIPEQADELNRFKKVAIRGSKVWGLGIAAGITFYAIGWYLKGTPDEAREIEKQEKEL